MDEEFDQAASVAVSSFALDEFASFEPRHRRGRGRPGGALTARQGCWAASISLKATAMLAVLGGPDLARAFFAPGWDLQHLEAERLDALQHALWAKAMDGDLPALAAILRIIQARCRLYGLTGATPDSPRPCRPRRSLNFTPQSAPCFVPSDSSGTGRRGTGSRPGGHVALVHRRGDATNGVSGEERVGGFDEGDVQEPPLRLMLEPRAQMVSDLG